MEALIKSICDSLTSHLYWCHHHSWEGKRFHRNCVRKYTKDLNNALGVFLK